MLAENLYGKVNPQYSERHNRRIKWHKQFGNERILHLMILPSVLCVILFSYFPMYGILAAFKRFSLFKGVLSSPWAKLYGFEHFADLFNAPDFGSIMRNTLVIAFLKLGLLSFPPIILAIILNEVKGVRFKKAAQTISYLPHFVSWVVVGGILFSLLAPMPNAPLNKLLLNLRLIGEPVDIINNTGAFWPLLLLSDMWKEAGWSSILYLAVIAGIDMELYEAIDIDGGGRWAKIRHVTWQSAKGTFIIMFILACGNIMNGMGETFEQCYVLGTAANRDVSMILDVYVLRVGIENGRYSFAAAAGLFKSVINLFLLLGANALSRRVTGKGLF